MDSRMTEGPPRLRPRSVTDLIDATFAMYRREFVLFAGVVAVLTVPETLLNMIVAASMKTTYATTPGTNDSFNRFIDTYSGAYAGSAATGLLGGIFGVLIMGALARAISVRFLGRPVTIPEAYTSVGLSRFLRLLAALVVGFCAFVLALIVVAIVIVLGTIVLSHAAGALGVLFAILASVATFALVIFVAVHFIFVPQCIVLEDVGVFGSFPRSWHLVQGYWWRVFGLLLLVSIIVSVFTGITGLFAAIISLGHPVLYAGISGVLSIIAQPIQLSGITLLYYDQRIRKEGFDLEYAAQSARGLTPA